MSNAIILALVREALEKMTDDERKEFFDKVTENYCTYCGSGNGYQCHCMNDE